MQGSGWVRDLREAMSLGNAQATALATNVATFTTSTTRAAQQATLDTLMANWADSTGKLVHGTYSYNMAIQDGRLVTSDLAQTNFVLTLTPQGLTQQQSVAGVTVTVPTAAGTEVLRRVNVLEVFNGSKFIQALPPTQTSGVLGLAGGPAGSGGVASSTPLVGTLGTAQIDLINQSYDALRDSVYGALVLQTRLKPYLDKIALTVDANGVQFDTTALAASLQTAKTTNAATALEDLLDGGTGNATLSSGDGAERLPESAAVAALPQIGGSGKVHDPRPIQSNDNNWRLVA